MGKSSRKTYRFPEYASAAPGGDEKRFVMLGVSLLEDERFLSLSAGAKVLYVYMKHKADPKPEFEMPHAVYKRFIDNKGFIRACRELEAAGFIKVIAHNQCLRKPNIYRFTSDWKKKGCSESQQAKG